MTSTWKNNNLKVIDTLLYGNQSFIGAWNKALILLPDGVIELAFVANKTGITIDRPYSAVDRINFVPYETCLNPGECSCAVVI